MVWFVHGQLIPSRLHDEVSQSASTKACDMCADGHAHDTSNFTPAPEASKLRSRKVNTKLMMRWLDV